MHYPVPSHLRTLLAIDQTKCAEHEVFGSVICPCGSGTLCLLHVADRIEGEGPPFLRVTEHGGHFFLRVGGKCISCGKEHLLFDCDMHGWNGYVCSDERIRRIPRPPFSEWSCHRCQSSHHHIALSIRGEDMQFALGEGEGILTPTDWFEGFGWFTVYVTCASCHCGPTMIMDYETM